MSKTERRFRLEDMPKKAEIVKQEAAIQPYALQQSILTLRGEHVLLDFQLAALYGVETKALNQAVKRNLNRFPEDFMFRLTPQEAAWMRSQIVTTYSQSVDYQRNDNILKPDKRRADALPYAFTEQGVAMLSSVLRSETAVQVNIAIMRAFVAARRLMLQNREHELAINELRMKMQMLEDALENNLGAVNDLSEEMKAELDNIYNAIGALSMKYQDPPKPKMNPIGYEATAARYEEEAKKKNEKN